MTRLAFDRSNRSRDSDGRLHVRDSVITAAVISPYLGRELPNHIALGLDPSKTYKLLRHPDELRKARASFDGVPLLSQHRAATADDHPSSLVVGAVWNPRFDGSQLIADLVIWPEHASRAVEDGTTRALSAGYLFVADMTPTVWRGERADGTMRDITANHVAIVSEPRVPDALVADSAFYRRSKPLKYFDVLRTSVLAADAAVRRRKARDEETTDPEMENEEASVDDLLAIVKTWLADMPKEEGEKFLKSLGRLAATGDPEMAASSEHIGGELLEDRARRGIPGARRARGAGDFLDRHVDRAHDAALPGVKPAAERFVGASRVSVMG